jgi:hypothetical protein
LGYLFHKLEMEKKFQNTQLGIWKNILSYFFIYYHIQFIVNSVSSAWNNKFIS